MGSFDQDKVDLIKQDGSRVDGITATVDGSKLIIIKGGKQIIEAGDLLIRKLSNGAEETYMVADPKYYERTPGAAGPHYQIEVRKLGLPEEKAAFQHIVYNVSGNNARINVGSVDNSTNIVGSSEIAEQIETIRSEIHKLEISESDRSEALEVVDAVESELAKPKPKKGVIAALLDSLPKIATIATAVAKIGTLVASVL